MRTLALFFLTICSCSTSGDENHATFSYDSCLLGCATTRAMMVGTEELIDVSASSIPPVTASSSVGGIIFASVKTTTATTLSINVRALAAGTAKLMLVEADGTTFDDVTLTVAEPASRSPAP